MRTHKIPSIKENCEDIPIMLLDLAAMINAHKLELPLS